MALQSIVSRTLLGSTLLGAVTLAAPSAHALPPLRPTSVSRPAQPTKPAQPVTKTMRVVMELTAKGTTDSTETGIPFASNTEDEVFYSLSGARVVGGKETAFLPTEVRPSGSRDIWEMGPNSNETLTRTLFEGRLSSADRAMLTVVVAEQDNAQRDALVNLFKTIAQYAGDALEKELGTEGTYDAFKGATKDQIVNDAVAVINDIGKRDDQVLGAFSVSASSEALKVSAGKGMFSKVVASSRTSAKLELSGYGGRYTVELRLEDAAVAPRPSMAVFLSEEYDKCGESKLVVGSKTIAKGQTVEVSVPKPRFDWRCGGSLEHTTAPAPTNRVQVKRAASGRDITWRCFFSSRLTPDFSW